MFLLRSQQLKLLGVLLYATQRVLHGGIVRDAECQRLGGASAHVAEHGASGSRTRSLKLCSLLARHTLPATSSSNGSDGAMGRSRRRSREERYKVARTARRGPR